MSKGAYLFVPGNGDERAYLDALYRDPCSYCDAPGGTLDHIHPRASGGTSDWANATGSCPSCNHGKGGRSLLGFLGARLHRARWAIELSRIYMERKSWQRLGL